MNSTQPISTLVIGAGISGLTAAYFAKKAGETVRILDEDHRTGGVIRSEMKNGFLLEYGPNTVLPNSDLMEIIDDLDLSNQMILGPSRLTRYIQFNGRLHPVPMSPPTLLFTQLLSAGGKLRLCAEPLIRPNRTMNDETLHSFAARRLGNEAAERLMASYVSGVWAGDPSQLSAEASFPNLVRWERVHGSILKGLIRGRTKGSVQKKPPRGLLSFHKGLAVLVDSMNKFLSADIHLNKRLERIRQKSPRLWEVEGSGFSFTAHRIIFSTPPWETARLISPLSPPAAEALQQIPYAPLAVIHWAIKKSDVHHDLNGFGYLVAPSEKLETLGCLWNSSIFPDRTPEGTALLTVFIGGARFPHILDLKDEEILRRAAAAVSPQLGFKNPPQLLALTRYDRSIPQYTLGHRDRMAVLLKTEEKFPGIRFAGNYIRGISVGDVIRLAKEVALSVEKP